AWSPDGKQIVYHSFHNSDWGLYAVDLVTLAITTVLDQPGVTEGGAVWAPDGSQLLFQSDANGNWDLYALDLTTGTVTQVTQGPGSHGSASVSPDGQCVVYHANPEGQYDLYLLNLAQPAQPIRLTDDPGDDQYPVWSPRGDVIAFQAFRSSWDIYLLDLTTMTTTRLSDGQGINWMPAWAPDGHQIAFAGQFRSSEPVTGLFITTLLGPETSSPSSLPGRNLCQRR
ncbi:MAG: PD40 domain-containing protein, partial [Deinococcus sp.]|nr:PD40 domain-containing protein [Deinococcus sp.]